MTKHDSGLGVKSFSRFAPPLLSFMPTPETTLVGIDSEPSEAPRPQFNSLPRPRIQSKDIRKMTGTRQHRPTTAPRCVQAMMESRMVLFCGNVP